MLFRHHDAAAHTNALNGLFDADAVVIGGRGLSIAEPRKQREPQPAASLSQPGCPVPGSPVVGVSPTTTARTVSAVAMPMPSPQTASGRYSGPAARVWASWVVSPAVSA
ncbi:hypothetical protein CA12_22230 [Alienimonas californiensis]|uniref:Uncharacterized protein n=1 Tax=Alienimonas californiensis TaxID=2527989 RepID=A0A517P9T5_9PLAN|nr:hypothetical protein CA12_22230 [Alienimonas californiensis]